MALTKCRECGQRISSKAAACPHCGSPLKGKARQTKPIGCCGIITLGVFGLFALALIATMLTPGGGKRGNPKPNEPVATAPPAPATAPPEPSNAQPGSARRVPHPGPVAGDMERIFEAAREQREHRAKREEGDEKDIAQIKAVYAAEKLGLPVRIIPTHDSLGGFRYIVVTGKHAAHVVYLTPESEVVSVREVYDAQGTPKGLAFLYRKQE